MVTDLILGIFHGIAAGFVGILPDMPVQPEWFTEVNEWFYTFNYFLPIGEMVGFLTAIVGPFVGIMVIIRVWKLLPFT